jgi:Mn2+/Fe2+ NRAMP family transporter
MFINFLHINPIQALFWTSVINGFVAPPLLVILMLIANSKKIMGDRTNHWVSNLLGGLATAVMFAAAIALVFTWLSPQ